MKKLRVIIALTAFLLTGMTVVSCSGNKTNATEKPAQEQTTPAKDSTASAKAEGFVCPMGCEKNKVYKKEGKCPDCDMNLVPTKS